MSFQDQKLSFQDQKFGEHFVGDGCRITYPGLKYREMIEEIAGKTGKSFTDFVHRRTAHLYTIQLFNYLNHIKSWLSPNNYRAEYTQQFHPRSLAVNKLFAVECTYVDPHSKQAAYDETQISFLGIVSNNPIPNPNLDRFFLAVRPSPEPHIPDSHFFTDQFDIGQWQHLLSPDDGELFYQIQKIHSITTLGPNMGPQLRITPRDTLRGLRDYLLRRPAVS